MVEEFFTVHPVARLRQVSKQQNGLPNRSKPYVSASMRLSSEHRVHHEEVFDPVNMFLRPETSFSWVLTAQVSWYQCY